MPLTTIDRCSICDKLTELPYETPADPPFYPAEGGRHCKSCEHWLLTGEFKDAPDDQ